jgi:hypothetical protein
MRLCVRYTHKTSGFKMSGFKMSGFKTSGFITSSFKTSGLQNVRFTKRQVSKRLVSKLPVFKIDITYSTNSIGIAKFAFLFKVRSVSLLLIMVIYGKKPSKIKNKTQPSLCLQTWLQKNLRISTNHKCRIYLDFFLQPDVLET